MKNLLPIILVISIFVFFAFSFFLPGFAKGVASKKHQLASIQQEEKNLPVLSNLLSTQSEKLTALTKVFPANEDLIAVVQSIDTLSAQTGVLASLHFESEQIVLDENRDSVLPVTITVEGDFANCIAFLSGLEHNAYLYSISKIEGHAADGLKSKNKFIIRGNLYASSN